MLCRDVIQIFCIWAIQTGFVDGLSRHRQAYLDFLSTEFTVGFLSLISLFLFPYSHSSLLPAVPLSSLEMLFFVICSEIVENAKFDEVDFDFFSSPSCCTVIFFKKR